MNVKCVWEHNGNDSLLYSINFIGAYTRGKSREEALSKMPREINAYLRWTGECAHENICVEIAQEKVSELRINDADSDVIFEERLRIYVIFSPLLKLNKATHSIPPIHFIYPRLISPFILIPALIQN